MPEGPTKLGTDLSDDHPVSFVFDSQLAADNTQLVDPSTLPNEVRLDRNEMLQCTSCHNPHGTKNDKFLVRSHRFSYLCRTCHQKDGWGVTSHASVSATWNETGTDPWQHTPFTTVDENACENCHRPHTAGSDERILNYAFEEDNCLVCHNANVASKDIETELTKPHGHFVQDYTGIHDPVEDFTSDTVQNHVECTDCHNPHWANSSNPPLGAPEVSGRNQGVKGIDASGQPVEVASNLYEICFKCHADNNVITTLQVDRQIQQLNTRLEFDTLNPSYHPVEAQGANPNVPSLKPPYTESSIIYCTDCHNNNDALGPSGPHGSTWPFILERRYVHGDFVEFDELKYALCFKCHEWDESLRDEESEFPHKQHMEGEDATCFTCHDPHGISYTQGTSINNTHLINFNLDIVLPHPTQGGPVFVDEGTFRGSCTLRCHNENHSNRRYPD